MDSFDFGRSFGSALMTFAIFVILQFVLAKIPAWRQKYMITAGIAFSLASVLLVASPAPSTVSATAGAIFVAACFWHFVRYGKSST